MGLEGLSGPDIDWCWKRRRGREGDGGWTHIRDAPSRTSSWKRFGCRVAGGRRISAVIGAVMTGGGRLVGERHQRSSRSMWYRVDRRWRPSISLAAAVRQSFEWCRSNR